MIQNLCGGISLDTNRVAMLRYSSDIKVDFDFYGGIHEPKVKLTYCEKRFQRIENYEIFIFHHAISGSSKYQPNALSTDHE